jgi:uncharacterized protein YkwD
VGLLAACGGGGDETTPAPTPAALPAGQPPPAGGSATTDCGIDAFAESAVARINRYRAAGATCGARGSFAPAAAVRWNDALAEAAGAHALDMAAQNYFSHTSADGRSLAQRVDATGYAWSALGENIAAGQVGIDAAIDAWMGSDGHCVNLMNPAFDAIGLACVAGNAASRYATYWTLDLARAR